MMTDPLRERIVQSQAEHVEGQLTNYDTGREECGCGRQDSATYREHLADAVIAKLSLRHVIDYCERQAGVGWRDVGTADEAMGRNIVAETVLTILEGVSFHGWNEQMDRP